MQVTNPLFPGRIETILVTEVQAQYAQLKPASFEKRLTPPLRYLVLSYILPDVLRYTIDSSVH